ncbi:Chromosome partition protein Smc [Carpediemonas membranifera]|uniref:Chromosome partition protein Smc n=1 Tax=Carpediemonas membranifera TaxID=201153 RepID=A0A8J6BVQ0_9EUKA|nr:Chromosome partition protein Smc [Carpediemonas membranifera]|eukprot:KAG9391641.1 Chromosome partition protein Smc [Carpediemonas membranifera]
MSFSLDLPSYVPSEWKNIPTPIAQTIQILLGQLNPLVTWVNNTNATLQQVKDHANDLDTRFKKYTFEMTEKMGEMEKRLAQTEKLAKDNAEGLAQHIEDNKIELAATHDAIKRAQNDLEDQANAERRRLDETLAIAESQRHELDQALTTLDKRVIRQHSEQLERDGVITSDLTRMDTTLSDVNQTLDDMDHTHKAEREEWAAYQDENSARHQAAADRADQLKTTLGRVHSSLNENIKKTHSTYSALDEARHLADTRHRETQQLFSKVNEAIDDHEQGLLTTGERIADISIQTQECVKRVESSDVATSNLLIQVQDMRNTLNDTRQANREFEKAAIDREARRTADLQEHINEVEERLVKLIMKNPADAKASDARFVALEQRVLLAEDSRLTNEVDITETLREMTPSGLSRNGVRSSSLSKRPSLFQTFTHLLDDRPQSMGYAGALPPTRNGTAMLGGDKAVLSNSRPATGSRPPTPPHPGSNIVNNAFTTTVEPYRNPSTPRRDSSVPELALSSMRPSTGGGLPTAPVRLPRTASRPVTQGSSRLHPGHPHQSRRHVIMVNKQG